jgi:hypothetical protein
MALMSARVLTAQTLDRRQLERVEQVLRQEGQAVVALADAAAAGQPLPADFALTWHNDFLKAQSGTFIPFIVSIDTRGSKAAAALLYVRAARRQPAAVEQEPRRGRRDRQEIVSYPFEEVYPVPLTPGQPVRISRGFALPAGGYDLTIVVRERERDDERGRKRLTAAARRTLDVPDFTTGALTTSTVMLADAVTVLTEAVSERELENRPYVIGTREIHLAADPVFRPSEELIVALLVYNPSVTPGKHFDLQVEYHFLRKNRPGEEDPDVSVPPGLAVMPGERYFNRTEPQRFTPVILGPQFDPAGGQPVLAGQGVPLTGFPEGDYRLAIRVTDLVSGAVLAREVLFSVRR